MPSCPAKASRGGAVLASAGGGRSHSVSASAKNLGHGLRRRSTHRRRSNLVRRCGEGRPPAGRGWSSPRRNPSNLGANTQPVPDGNVPRESSIGGKRGGRGTSASLREDST